MRCHRRVQRSPGPDASTSASWRFATSAGTTDPEFTLDERGDARVQWYRRRKLRASAIQNVAVHWHSGAFGPDTKSLPPFGAGGMGEVYRARDTRLDREVAIKVLSPGSPAPTRRASVFSVKRGRRALHHPTSARFTTSPKPGAADVHRHRSSSRAKRSRSGCARARPRGPDPAGHSDCAGRSGSRQQHAAGIVHRTSNRRMSFLTAWGPKLLDFESPNDGAAGCCANSRHPNGRCATDADRARGPRSARWRTCSPGAAARRRGRRTNWTSSRSAWSSFKMADRSSSLRWGDWRPSSRPSPSQSSQQAPSTLRSRADGPVRRESC